MSMPSSNWHVSRDEHLKLHFASQEPHLGNSEIIVGTISTTPQDKVHRQSQQTHAKMTKRTKKVGVTGKYGTRYV